MGAAKRENPEEPDAGNAATWASRASGDGGPETNRSHHAGAFTGNGLDALFLQYDLDKRARHGKAVLRWIQSVKHLADSGDWQPIRDQRELLGAVIDAIAATETFLSACLQLAVCSRSSRRHMAR